MNRKNQIALSLGLIAALSMSAAALDAKYQPIADAMKFAHKAPKGEKKVSDKILDGTVSDEDLKKTLDLYKAMADTPPPKGDAAAFKEKVAKLISATEDVIAKKDGAVAEYKEAVNCKSCHMDFRVPEEKKP
jgi:hypothetical protein